MNSEEQKQAISSIKMLLGARLNSQSAIGPDTVKGYLFAVAECSPWAIEQACTAFLRGRVEGFNNDFAPSGPRLAEEAEKWDNAKRMVDASKLARANERIISYKIGEQPPPPAKPLGPIKLEVDGIMRDTSDWTFEEKEEALRTGKMPKSKQIAAPESNPTRAIPAPKMQRVTR